MLKTLKIKHHHQQQKNRGILLGINFVCHYRRGCRWIVGAPRDHFTDPVRLFAGDADRTRRTWCFA